MGNSSCHNIGYFAGYLADAFTKARIELFWPSPIRFVIPGNRNLRLATGSQVEYGLLFFLAAITFFIININLRGGIELEVNRLLARAEGVEQVYNKQGASHLVIAHIKGVKASDHTPISGEFLIVEARGKEFIVQSKDGQIYKAGTGPDVELIADYMTADAGSPAVVKIVSLSLEEDSILTSLSQFSRPDTIVFISGELKVDYPEELHIQKETEQFQTMTKNGESIKLDDAPLAVVSKQLGDQYATGELSIRSIYTQPTTSTFGS